MQIDTAKVIIALDGKPLTDSEGKELSVKTICVSALMNIDASEGSGEEKLKRFILAQKIYLGESPVDITVEEAAMLKKIIGKGYGPAVVGPMFLILENKES